MYEEATAQNSKFNTHTRRARTHAHTRTHTHTVTSQFLASVYPTEKNSDSQTLSSQNQSVAFVFQVHQHLEQSNVKRLSLELINSS